MNKRMLAVVIAGVILFGLGGLSVRLLSARHAAPAAAKPAAAARYQCPMHPQIVKDGPGQCPICGMNLVPIRQETGSGADTSRGVSIDLATVQKMGVTFEPARRRPLNASIRAGGTLTVDETRVSVVSTKIAGWVEKLYVDFTGQPVKAGQRLLEIYSPDLVSAQEEYLQAYQYGKKVAGQDGGDNGTGSSLAASSKRRLLNWDITEEEIRALEERGTPNKTMTIAAPSSGVVLEKAVKAGQNVSPGMELYRIADLSLVWAVASVYPSDVSLIRPGQEAEISLAYLPGKTFKGRVSFISPVLDSVSKTVSVRIEVRNTDDFALKPNMFADIKLSAAAAAPLVTVPEQAIIRSGPRNIVVVSLGNGYFKPREVTLGVSADGYVQVLRGLSEGENVVTSAQFLIDSESNLRAAITKMGGSQ